MEPEPHTQDSWLWSQLQASVDAVQFRKALRDVGDGGKRWPLWGHMGLHDIRQRYRRSMLGPFWITVSMGVMVTALGLLYGRIFKLDLQDYLPYLTAGFVIWGFIANLTTDGTRAFTGDEGFIRQIAAPLSIHAYRVVWSNLIILGHNVLIYLVVAVWFQVNPGWVLLLALPALCLLVLNGMWISLFFGLVSARFRDIPLIVSSLVQVVFFITPVIWKPAMLPERTLLVDANPFYHLVEVMRGPLLGHAPSWENWLGVAVITVIGWSITLLFYTAYRWRIAYWV
jgi:ABC-2 type transport system permease protein/lipopolysaccharide transport system permease protein